MGVASKKSEFYKEIQDTLGLVPEFIKEVPEAALGAVWGSMRDFQLAETRIPNKYKELIGLAVSGATRCRYCVLFHTQAARLHGASDEELAEASMMGGITMMISTFLNGQATDFDRFEVETEKIVAHVKKQQASKAPRGTVEHGARA